jgi:hypothetical protein
MDEGGSFTMIVKQYQSMIKKSNWNETKH